MGAAPRGLHVCQSCERTSLLWHLDWWGRCPACRAFRPGLALASIVYVIVLVAVVVAVGADIEPGAKLAALLAIYPLLLVNIVMHEGTHALFARLLRWRVYVLAIGAGEQRARIRVGGTLVLLNRSLLAGGHCSAGAANGDPSRRAIAIYVGAPTVVHVVAAAVALRWASGDSFGGVLAAMFAASNLLLIPLNAWPHDPGAGRVTDGSVLLGLWREPATELQGWRFSAAARPLEVHYLEGKPEEAFRAAELALALDPGEPAAACLAYAAHATGRYEQALPHVAAYAKAIEVARSRTLRRLQDGDLAAHGLFRGADLQEYQRASLLVGLDRLEEVLAISECGAEHAALEETRALWHACVALALLMMGRDFDRAEDAARYAYERLPWVPFVETAWGMTRIERGAPAEGLKILDRVARIDRLGQTAQLRTAWGFAAEAALGDRQRRIPTALDGPNVWPACRRRAERALSGAC